MRGVSIGKEEKQDIRRTVQSFRLAGEGQGIPSKNCGGDFERRN